MLSLILPPTTPTLLLAPRLVVQGLHGLPPWDGSGTPSLAVSGSSLSGSGAVGGVGAEGEPQVCASILAVQS